MNKLMKFCLWAIAFTPFIIINSTFFPYITGESFFVRGVLVIVSILFLINFSISIELREKLNKKFKIVIKNPIFISILSFLTIYGVSTIFAINKYNAFWGTIERAEGFIGIFFFFLAFIYSLFIFDKKDWFIFFKLNLFVSFIFLIKEFFQFFSGISRPSSFLDNPTFLAGYLLFSIFCAIATLNNSKSWLWKYFSITTFILSIMGIFITETRGTLVGITAGFIVVLIYGIIKGKDISYLKINFRKTSIILLSIFIIFSTLFISTRKNEVWQKVPGLSRIAIISNTDSTTQTRLLMSQMSLRSVSIKNEGIKKFLIGWGPENFSIAYSKYFNPKQFDYEMKWFDRSHNKLLDLFVMNGLLGLVSYLLIYFFILKSLFKSKEFSPLRLGLIFLVISLLVHLLFVFDQVTTSIPFFMIISFILSLEIENYNKEDKKIKIKNTIIPIIFYILTLFTIYIFIRNDLFAVIQMKKYFLLRNNEDTTYILKNINSVFTPFTSAQINIRDDFLYNTENNYNIEDKVMVELSDIAIFRGEEYFEKNPNDIRFLAYLASAYSNKGKRLKNPDLLNKGEKHFKRMVSFAPNRPDTNYGLALNLYFQKKYDESFYYYEKALTLNPNYISQIKDGFDEVYSNFFQYFYNTKNVENFFKTAKRLRETNYIDENMFNQINNYIEKNNKLPYINFTTN